MIIEEGDTVEYDWHVSVSRDGQLPNDRICALVLRELGVDRAVEIPSVVNPYVRHFMGSDT